MRFTSSRCLAQGLISSIPLALLAGCSSTAAPTGAADSELRNGGICAPLDYQHTTSNLDYYRQFDSDEAATDFVRKIAGRGALASGSGTGAKFKEIAQDPRILRLVGEVYGAYQRVFPKETEGLPIPPRVVIIESSTPNAYALGPIAESDGARADQSPWMFFVNTELIDKPHSDTQLRGLFGHELGHLILRTFLPEIQQKLRVSYMIRGSENGILGAAADNDPAVEAHVEEILKRQSRVGGLPELGPSYLPRGAGSGYYTTLVSALLSKTASVPTAPPECKTAQDEISQLMGVLANLVPFKDQGLFVPRAPTAEEQGKIDAFEASIEKDVHACLANAPGLPASLLALTAGVNGLSATAENPDDPDHAKALALMPDAEKTVDAESPADTPLIDRIVRAARVLTQEELALRQDPAFPIDQLRTFDYEEDADDASARILSALGDDPTGVGQFVLSLMPKEAADACVADVAAGRPIPYGRFIDTHPADCWRYYHVGQFGKALAQCPTASSGKAQMKGSGQPSVRDQVLADPMNKGYGAGPR